MPVEILNMPQRKPHSFAAELNSGKTCSPSLRGEVNGAAFRMTFGWMVGVSSFFPVKGEGRMRIVGGEGLCYIVLCGEVGGEAFGGVKAGGQCFNDGRAAVFAVAGIDNVFTVGLGSDGAAERFDDEGKIRAGD